MQNKYDFYLNNTLVPAPFNWEALEVELSFENGSPDAILNATKLIWKGPNAAIINNWLQGGINGNFPGIFEGIPLRIVICNTQDVVFNGICDLTNADTLFNCDIIQVTIRDKRIDMINQLLDSVSFGALALTNTANGNAMLGGVNGTTVGPFGGAWINAMPEILGGDYIEVLYQNNNIPDYVEFMTMVLAIYQMVNEFIKIAHDVVGIISGIGAAAAGVGIGGVALGVLELLGAIAGLLAVGIALVDMFQMTIDYLISPVMTKFGMKAVTLLERACNYFGIQFSSTILNSSPFNNLVIMPSKRAWEFNQSITRSIYLGVLSTYTSNNLMMYDEYYNFTHNKSNNPGAYGYYDGTVGDLLRSLEDMFNAKAKVIMNASGQPVLYFERWDFFYNLANYKMDNVSNEAPFKQSYGTNANDIAANYMVAWATDTSDYNTLNDFGGNSCYYQVSGKKINNSNNITLKNLKEITLQFSHATQKANDTPVEEIINQVWADLVSIPNLVLHPLSQITKFINKILGTNISVTPIPTNVFQNLIGCMYLYNNVTDNPKAFIVGQKITYKNQIFSITGQPTSVTGYLIDSNNKGQSNMSLPNLSARALMRDFHYSSLVSTVYPSTQPWSGSYAGPLAGKNYYNQWITYKDIDIELCCSDYNLIYNNNIIKDYNNNFGRVDSLRWNVLKGMAKIDYRINQPYSKNLIYSYTVDGTQSLITL